MFSRCIGAALLFLSTASAVDWKALKPEGYVSDFAKVIDPQSRAQLEQYAASVKAATGAEMSLVTIPSLEGEPVEDVGNTIFRAWGVGEKGKNNGVLLLLAVQDRRMDLELGYEIEPIIPDGYAGSILREMRPALRQSHYGEAMLQAAHTIGQTIAQAKGVSIDAARPQRRIREQPHHSIPWPMLLGGLGLLFFLLRGSRSARYYRGGGGGFLPGLILGAMTGRSWHSGSSSHGGFGGYDSGDSFGGFGGGDSGGGGASSDW